MFDYNSRYHDIETGSFTAANGQVITYVKRRRLPQGARMQTLVTQAAEQGSPDSAASLPEPRSSTYIGLAMVRLIEQRLGEDRLRRSSGDVVEFLTAYQEAARKNPETPVAPPGSYDEYIRRLPLFDDESFARLVQRIREQTPAAPTTGS